MLLRETYIFDKTVKENWKVNDKTGNGPLWGQGRGRQGLEKGVETDGVSNILRVT